MDDPCSISVVMVNWNGREDTLRCLRSLEAQTDRGFAIVLVDNGSADGSVEAVRREFPRVEILETGENLGFAEGSNRGIAATRSAWVATLNNDTVADPRWIEELRRAASAASPRVGMLQSQVVFMGEHDLLNSTGVLLYRDGHASDRDAYAPVRRDDREEEVFCPTAGAALYRRSMLDAVKLESGYFDRTFFMYFEDVDLGWRCRLAGWEARYVPSARVHHAFQASSKRQPGRFVGTHLRRNRMRMLLKNGSLAFVGAGLPRTLYEACELVVWHGPRALRDVGAAVVDGLAQRRAIERLVAASGRGRRATEERWTVPSPEPLAREVAKQLRKLIT
jgi:GT2 family glycosyltransferase